jgi:hypothetical protein
MRELGLKIVVGLFLAMAGCGSSSQGQGGQNGDGGPGGDDPTLSNLEISPGALSQPFAPLQTNYGATFSVLVETATITPTTERADATIAVNGQPVLSGMASAPIPLSIGMNPITIEVTAAGKTKRYDVLATRKSSSDYVKASNTGEGDFFGYYGPLSLSGNTLAVGAPREDSDATGVDGDPTNDNSFNSGAVYVFTRSPEGIWAQEAFLKASNAGSNDQFGTSVSISGDTLAVGAALESSDATGVDNFQGTDTALYSGAVYVFRRSPDGRWSQEAYLKASNTGADDQFGSSVSLSGDALAVGAPNEDSTATGVDGPQGETMGTDYNSGAVYVFRRSPDGKWSQEAYLKASNTDKDDQFGTSVSLSGDLLAVGVEYEDSNSTGINGPQDNNDATLGGAVFVFKRSPDGEWTQEAYLKASNTSAGDRFGDSVSLSGNTLAVGADGQMNARGSVFVFTRSSEGGWSQQAFLKPSSDTPDAFGRSVSLSGDTLAVGAVEDSSSATGVNGDRSTNPDFSQSGAVYVFTRSPEGAWTEKYYLKASNTGQGDYFGDSVSVSGDTIAVSASSESSNATGVNHDQNNDSATDSGAVYVF